MGGPPVHLLAATASWSARHPIIALVLVIITVAGTGAGLTQIDEGRVQELFVPDDLPAQATLEQIEEIWGEKDGSFFLYLSNDPTAPTLLRAMADDAARLRSHEEVIEVNGIATILETRLGDLHDVPDDDLRAAARQFAAAPGGDAFVADDALLLRIATHPTDDVQRTTAALDAIADASTADVRSTGPLHLEVAQQASGGADVALLMPLSIGIMVLILALLFRRVQDVAVPMVTSFLALIMAYGTVAWAGMPLAPPSFVTMPLLLGLGIDYMLHIIYAYRETDIDAAIADRMGQAARRVGAPVFFTALTTLIGFGSFLVSSVPQIRIWGLLIGSGALYAFMLGFVALPAMYRIGRRKHRARALPFGDLLGRWSHVIVRHRKGALITIAIITSLLVVAATQLSIESELDFELDEDFEAVADFAAIEDRFGGQTTAQFLLPADDRRVLESLEASLDDVPGIGFVDGPVHRQGDTTGVETNAWWRVIVGYPEGDDRVLAGLRELGDRHGAELTGRAVVQLESQDSVLDSLFLSTGIAVSLVFLLLIAVFRDLRLAMLAFAPLVVTVAWQLGIQALVGIPLNPITGVITAMTLGIGVDYSLHITSHYRDHVGSNQAAARAAVAAVGRPVLAASITTVLAFSILAFSSLLPLQQFGYTAAIVITCAFIVSLTFLPALMSFGRTPIPAASEVRPAVYRGPVHFGATGRGVTFGETRPPSPISRTPHMAAQRGLRRVGPKAHHGQPAPGVGQGRPRDLAAAHRGARSVPPLDGLR